MQVDGTKFKEKADFLIKKIYIYPEGNVLLYKTERKCIRQEIDGKHFNRKGAG